MTRSRDRAGWMSGSESKKMADLAGLEAVNPTGLGADDRTGKGAGTSGSQMDYDGFFSGQTHTQTHTHWQ